MLAIAAKFVPPAQHRLWAALGLGLVALYVGLETVLDRLLPRWEGVWDYSHGYLVCGLTLWLLVERLRELRHAVFLPSTAGLCALLCATALYSALQQIDLTNGMFAILPIVLLALLWACGGVGLLRAGALPVLLLIFAIPLWDPVAPHLQDLATVMVREMLQFSGIPAFSEGLVIRTSRAAVEVAAACSGMTFLLASLTLCSFYSIAWIRSWFRGLVLVCAGVIVAIVSNWVRIYIITVAGHFSDMQHYLIVEDHEFFGWALFSVFMLGLIMFARRLELREQRLDSSKEQSDEHRQEAMESIASDALSTESLASPPWSMRSYALAVLALAVLIAPVTIRPEAVADRSPIPLALEFKSGNQWPSTEIDSSWMPESLNPAAVLRQRFGDSARSVDVYLAYFPVQAPGGKVTSTAHRLAPEWRVVSERQVQQAGIMLREQELVRGDQRRLLWTWFHVAGRSAPTLAQAKALEVLGILTGDRSGAVIALSTVCLGTCPDAGLRLEKFLTISAQALHGLSDTTPLREL
jgi:EpsI family protein